MPLIRIFLFFSLVAGCAPARDKSGENQIPPPQVNCPDGGDCSFELMQNAALVIKTDGTGKMYPEIEEGDRNVIRYHFKKDTDPDAMDSSYSEYVYFEIDSGKVELSLRDGDLQKVKMVFGRICYCKDAMGYFPVRNGQLFIYQNNGKLQLRTSFRVPKIPQIVTEIDENLTYYPR